MTGFEIDRLLMYSGYGGGKFSQIALFQLFKGENFINHLDHLVINVFSKHLKGKLFINDNKFVNFVKIYPQKNPLYSRNALI